MWTLTGVESLRWCVSERQQLWVGDRRPAKQAVFVCLFASHFQGSGSRVATSCVRKGLGAGSHWLQQGHCVRRLDSTVPGAWTNKTQRLHWSRWRSINQPQAQRHSLEFVGTVAWILRSGTSRAIILTAGPLVLALDFAGKCDEHHGYVMICQSSIPHETPNLSRPITVRAFLHVCQIKDLELA